MQPTASGHPSSRKPEILALAKSHPDPMGRALSMEAAANATGRWSIKGLGRRFAWSELIAASKDQRELFPGAPVEPCLICEDSGACEVSP